MRHTVRVDARSVVRCVYTSAQNRRLLAALGTMIVHPAACDKAAIRDQPPRAMPGAVARNVASRNCSCATIGRSAHDSSQVCRWVSLPGDIEWAYHAEPLPKSRGTPIRVCTTFRNLSEFTGHVVFPFRPDDGMEVVITTQSGRPVWRRLEGSESDLTNVTVQVPPRSERSFEFFVEPRTASGAQLPSGTYLLYVARASHPSAAMLANGPPPVIIKL